MKCDICKKSQSRNMKVESQICRITILDKNRNRAYFCEECFNKTFKPYDDKEKDRRLRCLNQ